MRACRPGEGEYWLPASRRSPYIVKTTCGVEADLGQERFRHIAEVANRDQLIVSVHHPNHTSSGNHG